MAKPSVAVLCNPASGRVRGRLQAIRELGRGIAGDNYVEIEGAALGGQTVSDLLARRPDLLVVVGGDGTATDAGSSTSAELGIEFSPDLLINGVVREVKTTRSFYEPKDPKADLGLYLEQLAVYQAATDTLVGQLWILYLNLKGEDGKTAPAFRCFTVELDQAGLDDIKAQVRARVVAITEAVAAGDHTPLPICREFKCGRRNCEWWDQCKPAPRYGTAKWEK